MYPMDPIASEDIVLANNFVVGNTVAGNRWPRCVEEMRIVRGKAEGCYRTRMRESLVLLVIRIRDMYLNIAFTLRRPVH